MGRYLVLWEMDQTKVPISPQERGTGWAALTDIIREDMKKGITKDFGTFVGELRGYSVMEGTEAEIGNSLQQFVPFAIFNVHAVASLEQTNELIKALTT
jgi:hypothetical protein